MGFIYYRLCAITIIAWYKAIYLNIEILSIRFRLTSKRHPDSDFNFKLQAKVKFLWFKRANLSDCL